MPVRPARLGRVPVVGKDWIESKTCEVRGILRPWSSSVCCGLLFVSFPAIQDIFL